jgi:hypothetical protein
MEITAGAIIHQAEAFSCGPNNVWSSPVDGWYKAKNLPRRQYELEASTVQYTGFQARAGDIRGPQSSTRRQKQRPIVNTPIDSSPDIDVSKLTHEIGYQCEQTREANTWSLYRISLLTVLALRIRKRRGMLNPYPIFSG